MIQGVIERYEDDQLVVAISDLAVVRGALTDLPVGEQDVDSSPELGLALLTLQDVASGSAELRARDSGLEKRVKEAKRPAGSPKGLAPSDLDTLIFWLREHFRSAYDGWIPTIGKNRVIDPVRGLPYLGGGGSGNPHFGGYGDPKTSSAANGGTSVGPHPDAAPPGWAQRAAYPGRGVRVGVLDTQLYPNEWLAGGYLATADDLLQIPAAGDPPFPATAGHATFIAGLILHQAAGNHGNVDKLGKPGDREDGSWTTGLTPKTPVWPAAFDEVIAVGAIDGDRPAKFSPQTPWVDVTAPGVNVESTYLTGEVKLGAPGGPRELRFSDGFARWDGTSFAAATVSGAVAAKIQPGRCDARQALAYICEEPGGEIRPFVKPAR